MLVSILMPTINPFPWLEKALSSIKSTARDYSQVEVLLWIDDDNHERIAKIPYLKERYNVKALVGPRTTPEQPKGYLNMGRFIDSLVAEATGRWAYLFDDDAWIEGDWQSQLEQMPCDPIHGPAAQAEYYCLGPSQYGYGTHPCGLIVPLEFARAMPNGTPADEPWFNRMKAAGWEIRPLKNVRYCHEGRPR